MFPFLNWIGTITSHSSISVDQLERLTTAKNYRGLEYEGK